LPQAAVQSALIAKENIDLLGEFTCRSVLDGPLRSGYIQVPSVGRFVGGWVP
jgi:hypothetical protein